MKNLIKKKAHNYWTRRAGKPSINNTVKPNAASIRAKLMAIYRDMTIPQLTKIVRAPNYSPAERNVALTMLHRRMQMR